MQPEIHIGNPKSMENSTSNSSSTSNSNNSGDGGGGNGDRSRGNGPSSCAVRPMAAKIGMQMQSQSSGMRMRSMSWGWLRECKSHGPSPSRAAPIRPPQPLPRRPRLATADLAPAQWHAEQMKSQENELDAAMLPCCTAACLPGCCTVGTNVNKQNVQSMKT